MKTNASRILDQLAISYELRAYEVDLDDLSAPSVAKKIGLPPEQVFKTLLCETVVASGKPNHIFAVVPGDAELDLKKLAHVSGHKNSISPASSRSNRSPATSAAASPSSPRASLSPAFADETIQLFDRISVSAGQRGLQLLLHPDDYLRATEAVLADLTKAAQ